MPNCANFKDILVLCDFNSSLSALTIISIGLSCGKLLSIPSLILHEIFHLNSSAAAGDNIAR